MTVIDELVQNANAYGDSFDSGNLPLPPAKRVAIVACMDARLNPYGLLGCRTAQASSRSGPRRRSPTSEDVRQSIARIKASPFPQQGARPWLRLRGRNG